MRIHQEDEIEVARAPAAVLAFLADLEQQPRYWATVVAVRRLDGAPGRPGATYERTLRVFGRARVTTVEIRSMDAPHVLVLENRGCAVRVAARLETFPARSGTKARVCLDVDLVGAWRLLAPLLRRRFARNTRETLARLKGLLEAPYVDAWPPTRPSGARAPGIRD